MQQSITLQKFQAQDFDDYYRMAGDARIMQMITGQAMSRQQAAENYALILERNTWHTGLGYFKVLNAAAEVIGLGKLQPERQADLAQADLGYMLRTEYWGQGYGTVLSRQLLIQAQGVPDLKLLTATIHPDNAASRRIIMKLGFQPAGQLEVYGTLSEFYTLNI